MKRLPLTTLFLAFFGTLAFRCPAAETPLPLPTQELRKAFADARAARERAVPTPVSNAAGGLAWGEAGWLDSVLSMFEATGDAAHLDYFLRRARVVLALRDSVTGVRDYRGRGLPAWTSNAHYTQGRLEVRQSDGALALVIESAAHSYNNATALALEAGPGHYTLKASNERAKIEESFDLAPSLESIHQVNARSRLVRVRPKAWPASKAALETLSVAKFQMQRMVFSVHTGMIAGPLARFASIVKAHGLKQYRAEAAVLAEAARRALLVHEGEFARESGRGWYSFPYGAPMWCDGCPCPNNYSCAMGRAFVHLNRYDPQKFYSRRIEEVARGLKGDMTVAADGAMQWHYWRGQMVTGWKFGEVRSSRLLSWAGSPSPEDSSHGAIDVEFACMAHRDGFVFTRADIDAIARTLTKRMLMTGGHMNRSTAGTGSAAERFSPPWLALTASHPELVETLRPYVSGVQWLSVFPVRR